MNHDTERNDNHNEQKSHTSHWLQFILAFIAYIIISIISLYLAKSYFVGISGDLARWLTFATIVQAVVASAAIVGVSVVVLVYSGKAEKIFSEQTQQHRRSADVAESDKVEKDIHQIFDHGIRISTTLVKIFSLHDSLINERISHERAHRCFYDYQMSLMNGLYSLSESPTFVYFFKKRLYSVFERPDKEIDIVNLAALFLPNLDKLSFSDNGDKIEIKHMIMLSEELNNAITNKNFDPVVSLYNKFDSGTRVKIEIFVNFLTVVGQASARIIYPENMPNKISILPGYIDIYTIILSMSVVSIFKDLGENMLNDVYGSIGSLFDKSKYLQQMSDEQLRGFMFSRDALDVYRKNKFDHGAQMLSFDVAKYIRRQKGKGWKFDKDQAREIAAVRFSDSVLDDIFNGHLYILQAAFPNCSS